MCCDISFKNVQNFCLRICDVGMQAGVGFAGGHLMNAVHQYLNPGKLIIGKPYVPLINPMQAGISSLIFAVIDAFAKEIFEKILGEELNKKPVSQVIRMAGTIALSALIASGCLNISFTLAATAIATEIAACAILMGAISLYHQMVYPPLLT